MKYSLTAPRDMRLSELLAAYDPAAFFGGTYKGKRGKAEGNFLIAEACEYKRGLLYLKPYIAVVLNAELDHTDCYDSQSDVVRAFAEFASGAEIAVAPSAYAHVFTASRYTVGVGADGDYACIDCVPDGAGSRIAVKTPDGVKKFRLRVPGRHMRVNALNAALVMSLFGAAPEQTAEILAQWPGIEHRLEFFHEWANGHGARAAFYNDSAATVPEAAAAALSAFSVPLHLICGGADKNLNFEPLAQALSSAQLRPASLWLLAGSGTDKLCALLEPRGVEAHGPYDSLETLLCELRGALSGACAARGEQAVVFSPGATSFNMFRNEFDRGAVFKELVRRIFS